MNSNLAPPVVLVPVPTIFTKIKDDIYKYGDTIVDIGLFHKLWAEMMLASGVRLLSLACVCVKNHRWSVKMEVGVERAIKCPVCGSLSLRSNIEV